MIDKINKLKEKYANATTNKEREQIYAEISKLSNNEAFADAMLQSLDGSIDKAKQLNKDIKIRQQLEGSLEIYHYLILLKLILKSLVVGYIKDLTNIK